MAVGMTLDEAKKQARLWWGSHGAVELQVTSTGVKYKVGITALDSRLGGRITGTYGVSWKSFDEAFANAETDGWEPDTVTGITGFENDEAIEDEA